MISHVLLQEEYGMMELVNKFLSGLKAALPLDELKELEAATDA